MGRRKTKSAARHRPGTAVQAKGRQRVDEILDAAVAILVEDGYAELTTRRIASRVGIRLSNVQYYFPSKQDLLQALVERSIKDYYETLQARIGKGSKSPKAQLRYSIDYVLASHAQPNVGTLFKELWALAAHDADAARVMDAFYEQWRSMAADTVQELNPKLGRRRAERRAALIIGMVDGQVLLSGKGSKEPAALKTIAKDMRDAALAIAMAP